MPKPDPKSNDAMDRETDRNRLQTYKTFVFCPRLIISHHFET